MSVFSASSQSEIEAAFAKMAQQQVGALIGGSDTFLSERRETIVSLAAQYRIPAIYLLPEGAEKPLNSSSNGRSLSFFASTSSS
jgi:putative tryptophan/tyrosine transport system substrate-binding protein